MCIFDVLYDSFKIVIIVIYININKMDTINKIISCFIIVIFLCSEKISGQSWVTVNPKPIGGDITGVSFIDTETGFMSCSEGTILRTQDGGLNWDIYISDATDYFLDIKFVSESKGFIVGHDNAIGKTTDGGDTWNFIQGPGESTYWKMYFADEMHGWVCGWYSTLLRTQDGGNTWQLLSQNIWNDKNYFCMDFLNNDTGYIAGAYGIHSSQAKLYRTIDGGVTVQEIALPAESEEIIAIDALNYNEIWLCEGRQINAQSRVYHTTDAGLTWETKVLGIYTSHGSNIKFFTPLMGRATGGSSCFSTEDGGATWSQDYFSTTNASVYLRACDWINDSIAFAGGGEGYIFKTKHSGSKWQEMSHGSRAAFSDIDFIDNLTGCAVGAEQGIHYIYRTSDGGETWTSVLNSANNGWICDIEYQSATEVWASGSYNRVYHSTDGGINWSTINPTENELNMFYSVCPVNSQRIYAGGTSLVYTVNNGLSWQSNNFECPGYEIRKVIFTDPMNGYLTLWENGGYSAFYGKLFSTNNGGNSWEEINYNPQGVTSKILAADFLNKDTGIISIHGSGIALTRDGGLSWDLQGYIQNMVIYYLKMFNASEVVAVTANGAIFYSYNGGSDWEEVEITDNLQYSGKTNSICDFLKNKKPGIPSDIDGLKGTCFTGMGAGWLCRDGGLIKKYSYLNVGIAESAIMQSGTYRIFPNPTSNKVQIIGDVLPDYILVYNSLGNCVYKNSDSSNEINVSHWPSGVYYIQVFTGFNCQSIRFLKQ